jgi:hypothetical protein
VERIVVTSPSRHRRAALSWAPNQAREQFDDKKFHDKGNADSRCDIVAGDRSRDGDGTKRCRRRQQQGRDRHSNGKPADEHPGDWHRPGRDIQSNRADLPGDGRPDQFDAARCYESCALLTSRRRQKLTPLIRWAGRATHPPGPPRSSRNRQRNRRSRSGPVGVFASVPGGPLRLFRLPALS